MMPGNASPEKFQTSRREFSKEKQIREMNKKQRGKEQSEMPLVQ
jgi:hypothetical protein